MKIEYVSVFVITRFDRGITRAMEFNVWNTENPVAHGPETITVEAGEMVNGGMLA